MPSIRTIIPLTPAGIESEGDEIFKLTTKDGQMSVQKEKVEKAKPAEFAPDMIFEQEPSQLLNALLPLYLNGQLLRILQESVASELASRMQAMQPYSTSLGPQQWVFVTGARDLRTRTVARAVPRLRRAAHALLR